MLTVDVPGIGPMTATMDLPSFGINHSFAYAGSGRRLAERIETEILKLGESKRIAMSSDADVTINGVAYKLTANLHKTDEGWKAWWQGWRRHHGGELTENARRKLNEDDAVNGHLIAWADANFDSLHGAAAAAARQKLGELIVGVAENLEALRVVAGIPVQKPYVRVEVSGGVAEIVEVRGDVEVDLVDYDVAPGSEDAELEAAE